MGRTDTRTRIAALIEDDKAVLGLTTVLRYVPEGFAGWEPPALFVAPAPETITYPQMEKLVNRNQVWALRLLWQEVGKGWTADHQQKMDNCIDDIITLLNGNPVLRRSDNGPEGLQQSQWAAVRMLTPYAFPAGQDQRYYHAAELTLLTLYSELCQS